MSSDSFKVKNSINIAPKASPTLDQDGDLAVDSSDNKLKVRTNSSTQEVLTNSSTNTVTNKSIDADTNTITNIENADIKAAAAIDATKIANGSVSNTEFQYLDGVTSAIQTQITAKADAASPTFSGTITTPLTASRAVVTGVSSQLSASSVTSTELGYVSGVTSAIQTQFTGKTDKSTLTTTGDMYYASSANTPARLAIGSTNQVLKVSGGLPAWGAAASGGVNYVSANPDAEADTTGWSTYADAAGTRPVDGTGGSPNSTWTRTTSSPLRGTASFLWTKSGSANRQGEGVAYAFTIDAADKAKVLQISFDYLIASGTFVAGSTTADSDLIVYIYDVTNSTLIEPSSIKLLSNSSTIADKFVGNFQTSATGTSYRLIIHTATTVTSNYTVQFDNFAVSPSNYVYGTPITDWVSYTPTFTGFGTATSISVWSRRVGDSLQLKGSFTSGTATAVQAQMTLGYGGGNANVTTDNTKAAGTLIAGHGNLVTNSTTYFGLDILSVGNANYINFGVQTSTANSATAANGNAVGSTLQIAFYATIPITGWSSSTQVSDGYDGRVIAARYTLASTTAIGTSAAVLPYTTLVYDTTSSYNTSTGLYTCPSSGFYKVNAMFTTVGVTITTANGLNMYIRKNGSDVDRKLVLGNGGTTVNYSVSYSSTIQCNAGDTLGVYADSSTATTAIATANLNVLSIEKVQAPTTISATEVVAASYRISADKTPTVSNPIDYDTKIFDTHNAVTTGVAWKFTAPVQGFYRVTTTNATSTTGGTLDLYKNLAQDRGMMSMADTAVRSASATVELLAGGTISINPDSASKTFTGTKNNTIYIERIK